MTIIISLCLLLLIAIYLTLQLQGQNTVCYIIITFRLDRESNLFDINLPDLTATLPVLGTIGLILIV
jgi:hypothetical protein